MKQKNDVLVSAESNSLPESVLVYLLIAARHYGGLPETAAVSSREDVYVLQKRLHGELCDDVHQFNLENLAPTTALAASLP